MHQPTPRQLPATVAIVDDEAEFSEALLAKLRQQGASPQWFADSEALLCADEPFGFDLYILDLGLPGIDGLSLLRLLRRRSKAGVLVVSGRLAPDTFEAVIDAGADMYLAKPVSLDQVHLAATALFRRTGVQASPRLPAEKVWWLDEQASRLCTPEGASVDLSSTDLRLLQALQRAEGHAVSREALAHCLGLEDSDANVLNATVYRLRRRIGTVASVVPLQTRSRQGYQFLAPLALAS